MKIKILSLLFLTLAFSPIAQSAWRNSGTMTFNGSNMNVPEFENTGNMVCNGETRLRFTKLTGNGVILVESGKTIIEVEEFLFTGIIDTAPDAHCEVYTFTQEAEMNFSKEGQGVLTINVLKNE